MRAAPWAACMEGRTYYWRPTVEQAINWSTTLGQMVAHPPTFRGNVAAMQRANPNLILGTYTNTVLLDTTQAGVGNLPEDAFSHDADGNRITVSDATFTNLLHPLSEDAIRFKINDAIARHSTSGYPDLYMDVAGSGPLGRYSSSPPIDPRTGQTWTVSEWYDAIAALEKAVHEGVQSASGKPTKLILN